MTTNDTSDNLDKKKYLRDRKKADIGNLMDIIVAKLNDGCTYSFVATGLGEWLHYIISPDEIRDLTSDEPLLLPLPEREKNAEKNIYCHDLKIMKNFDTEYLHRKYGYSYQQLNRIFRTFMDGCQRGEQAAALIAQVHYGYITMSEAYKKLTSELGYAPEDVIRVVKKTKSLFEKLEKEVKK